MSSQEVIVRAYQPADIPAMTRIWNHIVEAGDAFPQLEPLSEAEAAGFFAAQSFTGVAESGQQILGLYILHPNNVGRCGHIANSSYAVSAQSRGRKVGEKLVRHSLQTGRELGFRILQFNAVVVNNLPAIRLYEKLGFQRVGIIPNGFRLADDSFIDIIIFYINL